MTDLLIKPLRAYEDRGTIRDVDHEPYAAPVWLAKELEQLSLCKIVGEVDAPDGALNQALAQASGSSSTAAPTSTSGAALQLQKKGQRWIIVDATGSRVGNFIGKQQEAEAELAKLLALPAEPVVDDSPPAPAPAPVAVPPAPTTEQPAETPAEQPTETPAAE